MPVIHVAGDVTRFSPTPGGFDVLVHVVNNRGGWGKGVVKAISRRWSLPEKTFRDASPLALGTVQWVGVENGVYVVNLCAQEGYSQPGAPAIRLGILELALDAIAQTIRRQATMPVTVHMPRIGAGLGGGNWAEIEPLISDAFFDVPVRVYTL